MNQNSFNRLTSNPVNLDISRSKFDRSHSYSTTFNASKLIPFFLEPVLPGDSFNVDTNLVCRMTTPIFPVMDSANIDLYYFFVPKRLVWSYTKQFLGENTTGPWVQEHEYIMPYVQMGNNSAQLGSVADYLGIPTGVKNLEINMLPLRSYYLIWNEWFRDQNTQAPVPINLSGDGPVAFASGGDSISTLPFVPNGLLTVNKYHDLFTTCLRDSQKHSPVIMPISGDGKLFAKPFGVAGNAYSLENPAYFSSLRQSQSAAYTTTSSSSTTNTSTNIYASFENATLTVNQVREAFAIQRLYEKDAMGGTRMREMIKAHYGVTMPDYRAMVPEFLGGKRIPITVNQVVQTSATGTGDSPQGNTGAYSLTVDKSNGFTKSFTEPGYIMGVMCVRTVHTYSQGLDKFWSHKRRFDEYYPALANIGNVPLLKKEICATGTDTDNEVFGFNEAWYEYRFKNNILTNKFRPSLCESGLAAWNYGDYFETAPTLNSDFMYETDKNIQRTLAVEDEPQFLINMYIQDYAYRPMPTYSIPGLIDHH